MEEVALVVVAKHVEVVARLVGGHALGQCRRRRGVRTRQVYRLPVQVCRQTEGMEQGGEGGTDTEVDTEVPMC